MVSVICSVCATVNCGGENNSEEKSYASSKFIDGGESV
jgi:hypothetical protein